MKTTLHISLTGHRPTKLGGYNTKTEPYKRLQKDLEQFIRMRTFLHDAVVCHSGLALGADSVWAEAILAMKSEFPDIVKFHADIPMMTQADRWFDESKEKWQYYVNAADTKTVYGSVIDGDKHQAIKLLNDRNKGMIAAADIVLAVWDGTPGGTANAVKYAQKLQKDIRIVHPNVWFK